MNRDEVAVKAMSAILNQRYAPFYTKKDITAIENHMALVGSDQELPSHWSAEELAEAAFEIADAMIKQGGSK